MTASRAMLAAIACAAALSAAGCSAGAKSYEDVSALGEAVAGEGVACDRVDRQRGADLVSEIGSCRGDDVTLFVFEAEEAFQDWKRVGPLAGSAALGSNWAAVGDRAVVERIAGSLGGEISGATD